MKETPAAASGPCALAVGEPEDAGGAVAHAQRQVLAEGALVVDRHAAAHDEGREVGVDGVPRPFVKVLA